MENAPCQAESAYYTDGAKTNEKAGAGTYTAKPKILTIHHCAKEISKSRVNGKTVAINTNSQATLQTLSSIQVYSKALDQLCRQNRSNLEDIEGMNRLTY